MRRSVSDRFWSKVDRSGGPDSCWLWRGNLTPLGYGRVGYAGRVVLAHRMAWELSVDDIPAGLWVLHRCDVPGCVNPAHLFLGTALDNARDRDVKGRGVVRSVCKHGHAREAGSGKPCLVCRRLKKRGWWPLFLASSPLDREALSRVVLVPNGKGRRLALPALSVSAVLGGTAECAPVGASSSIEVRDVNSSHVRGVLSVSPAV